MARVYCPGPDGAGRLCGAAAAGPEIPQTPGPLPEEQQKFADGLFLKLLRQSGLVFAALSFMIMRSVRLMASTGQQILLYIAVILQIVGAVALILPVERNLKAYFDDQEDET